MEMLWHYCVLIWSKMDYGSFIYGSTMKSKLTIPDLVLNTRIHVAICSFHTRPLESLYVECGEPPFSLHRKLFLYSFITKLSALPHHLLFGAVFHQIRAPTQLGVCVYQLLEHLDIHLPCIIPSRFSDPTLVSHISSLWFSARKTHRRDCLILSFYTVCSVMRSAITSSFIVVTSSEMIVRAFKMFWCFWTILGSPNWF